MTKRKVWIHIFTSRLTLGRAIFDASEEMLGEDLGEEELEAEAASAEASGELPEPTEMLMEGRLVTSPERVELIWEESELTGMEGSVSSLGFQRSDAGLVSMMRTGPVRTALIFEEGKRHFCIYRTPFSEFEVCVYTRRVENGLLTEGRLFLDYLMEIHGAQAERCRMTVTLRPAEDGEGE